MPNHVTNYLTVTGPEWLVKEFHLLHGDEIDISASVPMPEPLKETHTGGATIEGERVNQWLSIDGKNVKISDQNLEDLQAMYGATNWYDWAIKYWGTKWGSYEAELLRRGHGLVKWRFESAWSPPDQWLYTVRKLYPDLTFKLIWHDEGEDPYEDMKEV